MQAFFDAHIEERAADGGHDAPAQGQTQDDGPARELGDTGLALGGYLALVQDALLPGALHLVVAAVGDERLAEVVGLSLAEVVLGVVREVVHADDHVLAGHGDGLAVRRRQDVVGAEHEHAGLGLRLPAERQVHCHLVAVEVGVERGADEGVDLDGLALDKQRLKGLDAEAVQGGRPVEQHGVLGDDLFEDVPDLGHHRLDHLLGRLDVLHHLAVDEAAHDERLEELEGHHLGQAALVHLEVRSGDDDGAAGVVDALAEQVLAEAALLALEHVAERLEGAVAGAGDGAPAAAVVEERVDGLLQHALLVVDDDVGRLQVEQPLEAVVPVDDAPVEIVEVAGGKTAAVELHHRAQLGGDDGDDVEDHPLGVVAAAQEGGDDLEALDGARLALTLGGLDGLAQLGCLGLEVDALEQLAHGLGAGAAGEVHPEALRLVAGLAPEHTLHLLVQSLVVDDIARRDGLELIPGAVDLVLGVTDVLEATIDVVVAELVGLGPLQLELVGTERRGVDGDAPVRLEDIEVVEVAELVLGVAVDVEVVGLALAVDDRDELVVHVTDGLRTRLGVRVVARLDLVDLLLQHHEIVVAALGVDRDDDVAAAEVEHLLELLGSDVEQVAHARRHALEEPDVAHGGRELDVAHALTAHLGAGDLDAAALADDALVAHALVLAAVALPVLGGTEDALAEQTVTLGLERAVVDRLGLGDLALRPRLDLLGRCQPDADRVEVVDIDHSRSLCLGGVSLRPSRRRRT